MRKGKIIVKTSNIVRLASAAEDLLGRSEGLPGLGLLSGGSGYGKSYGIAWVLKYVNGVYVCAWPGWREGSMLRAVAEALGIDTADRRNTRLDSLRSLIVRELSRGRVLFVDDADPLVSDSAYSILIETLRRIHDSSRAPIVMVGTERLQRGVMVNEQVAGRIGRWVEFAGATLDDARLLANELCEVKIGNDLIEALHSGARGGSVRRICTALDRVEAYARKNNLAKISLADWGARQFTFGEPAPALRAARSEGA